MPPSSPPASPLGNMGGNTRLQCVSPPAVSKTAISTSPVNMAHSAIHFLDLPAEIRNMIYHYLFPEGRSAVQLLKRNVGIGYISMSDRLGIIATCKQVYTEAKTVLHKPHRLTVVKPKTFKELVRLLWIGHAGEAFDNQNLQYLIPEEGIHLDYDLDKHSLVRNTPPLMYTEPWLRKMCILNPAGARITALLRTASAKSAFGNFQTLQTWIRDGHHNPINWNDSADAKTEVILAFDSNVLASSADVKIDATALLRGSHGIQNPETVLVRVKSWANWQTQPSTVGGIQKRVLLFMWHLIQEHPEARKRSCPAILVNGRLWPVEAEFVDEDGGVHILTNKRMPLQDHTDAVTSHEYARVVEALRNVDHPDYSEPEDEDEGLEVGVASLFEMDFDRGSLLGVAAGLAQLIHDNECTWYWDNATRWGDSG